MMTFFIVLAAAAQAYLLGSVDTGILVSKYLYHDDVRNHGSGAAGMTNMLRTFGKKAAAFTAAGDVLKGVAAVCIGRWLFGFLPADAAVSPYLGVYLTAILAVVGHTKPIYFGFKGGKGVLVAGGAILAVQPILLPVLTVVFLLCLVPTGMVSLGSIAMAASYPVLTLIYGLLKGFAVGDLIVCVVGAAIMGGMVIAVGVLCLFTLRDAPGLAPNRDPRGFWHQFAAVFDYKIVGRNRELFWVFLVMMVYFIGFNVYFPYITVYFTDNLGMDYTLTGVVQGAGLLAASVLTIPAARFIDRGKCGPVIAAAVGCNLLGLLGVSFSTAFVPLLIGVFGAGAGYILVLQALTAWIKNLYPEDQRGQFEGVKQLFFVCVPMIVGPAIATPVINAFGVEKIVNGVAGMVPGNSLFLISGLVTLLALLPLFPAARMEKARAGAAAQP